MRADGVSLIELLAAMAFMAVVILCAHQALIGIGRRAAQMTDGPSEDMRQALTLIAENIRSACLSDADASTAFVLRNDGGFGVIDFFQGALSGDRPTFTPMTVSIERDAAGRWTLVRRTREGPAFLCGDVTAFEVEAFDGERWQRRWGWDEAARRPTAGVRGLPLAVSLRLVTESGGLRRERRAVVPIFTALLLRAARG